MAKHKYTSRGIFCALYFPVTGERSEAIQVVGLYLAGRETAVTMKSNAHNHAV
jgi:hypothetical protein